jgi:hypothetical protein
MSGMSIVFYVIYSLAPVKHPLPTSKIVYFVDFVYFFFDFELFLVPIFLFTDIKFFFVFVNIDKTSSGISSFFTTFKNPSNAFIM